MNKSGSDGTALINNYKEYIVTMENHTVRRHNFFTGAVFSTIIIVLFGLAFLSMYKIHMLEKQILEMKELLNTNAVLGMELDLMGVSFVV